MKPLKLFILITLVSFSCKSKSDKAVRHLEDWFDGYDSVKTISDKSKRYYKSADLFTKEIAVESVIDKEMGFTPTKQQVEFKDSTNNTRSYYMWEDGKNKLELNVYYTNPTSTPGMRFELTQEKK